MEQTRQKTPNRDVDLQKAQVLANHYGEWFNFLSIFVAGGIILLLTISYTIYSTIYTYHIVIGSIAFVLTGMFMLWVLGFLRKEHKAKLEKINKIVDRIEKGDALPSILELYKELRDS